MDSRSADEIRTLLTRWQAQQLTAREVHEYAEELWSKNPDWPHYPHTDPRSIPLEVLLVLESLNVQLITPEDILTILTFLDTPSNNVAKGWAAWIEYWDSIDFERRGFQLRNKKYYDTSTYNQIDAPDEIL